MNKAQTYQGTPCKKGGHTLRYVSTSHCVVCVNSSGRKRYAENTEECKAQHKKWAKENPKKIKLINDRWQKKNPEFCSHKTAERRAKKKQRTPPWAENCPIVKQIYIDCPKGYEVDHIHPLSKGGLHVHWNLQYLTISENRSKGAKLDYECNIH